MYIRSLVDWYIPRTSQTPLPSRVSTDDKFIYPSLPPSSPPRAIHSLLSQPLVPPVFRSGLFIAILRRDSPSSAASAPVSAFPRIFFPRRRGTLKLFSDSTTVKHTAARIRLPLRLSVYLHSRCFLCSRPPPSSSSKISMLPTAAFVPLSSSEARFASSSRLRSLCHRAFGTGTRVRKIRFQFSTDFRSCRSIGTLDD